MKLRILKQKLKDGLETVSKISQKRLSLPILANVLLETEKNFLKLSSTNLESGINWWGLAKIEKEGKLCLDSKFLLNVVSSIKEETVVLEGEEFDLRLENKGFFMKIKGVNYEEFPIIPSISEYEKISLDCREFCQGLSKISHIPSPSIGRPEISGVYFFVEKNFLKLVATDSFRLSELKISTKFPVNKIYSFILPQEGAREILGIFSSKEGEINLYLSPNQVFFESLIPEISHPEIIFTSRLIEGEYPNYQEIIPKKFKTKAHIDRMLFLSQVKTASLFSGRINEVKLKFDPQGKKIEILSQNPDFGEYRSQISAEIEGEAMTISFNYRFLIDGISNFEEKKLEFSLSEEEGPAMIKPSGVENYFYILMPIKAS